MAENTAISWATHTFNPWMGCTKVSPACDGCYAEALMDKRYGRVEWGAPGQGNGTRVRTSAANWKQPLKWNRQAEKDGTRPFVFCASLADVFDNQVPAEWRRDLFDLIRATPNLVWLLLTKRPQNIVKMSEAAGGLPSNAALGSTCEDQRRLDINAPELLRAKSLLNPAFAFLSCEPLLGPLDAWNYLDPLRQFKSRIDWVITGGETDQGGHQARLTHPQWLRSLRDQCAAAGTAYHHKQNGEWLAISQMEPNGSNAYYRSDRKARENQDQGVIDELYGRTCTVPCTVLQLDGSERDDFPNGAMTMFKVGKNRSGRLLDGVTHDAFPEVSA